MTPEQICRTYSADIVVRRWAGTWIDLLLFATILAGLLAVGGAGSILAFILIVLVYYPLLEGLTGQTLGKLVCGMKVVDAQGRVPGIPKAIIRTLIRFFEVNPLLMGGLPAGIAVMASQTRQRLGDMAAQTYVLRVQDAAILDPHGPPASPPLHEFVLSPLPDSQPPTFGGPYPPPYAREVTIGSAYAEIPPTAASPHAVRPLDRRRPRTLRWAFPSALAMSLFAAGFVWWGVRAGEAESRKQPTTLTITEFLKSPPRTGWYRLTGCVLDLEEATYETFRFQDSSGSGDSLFTSTEDKDSEDTIDSVYLPVYASGRKEGRKSALLVATRDGKIIRAVRDLKKLDSESDDKVDAWMKAHFAELEVRKTLTGTVSNGADSSLEGNQAIKLQDKHLENQFVLLTEGDSPVEPRAVAAIACGVMSGVLAGLFWLLSLVHLTRYKQTRAGQAGIR